MFEASSVHFQCVNEHAASVKNRPCFQLVSTWTVVNLSFFSLPYGFRLLGLYELNSNDFGSIRMTFFLYFCKIFVPGSERPPLNNCVCLSLFWKRWYSTLMVKLYPTPYDRVTITTVFDA